MPKQYIISEGGTRGIPIEVEKPKREDWLYGSLNQFIDSYGYKSASRKYNAALEEAKKNAIDISNPQPERNGEVITEGKDFDFVQHAKFGSAIRLLPSIPHTDHRGEESKRKIERIDVDGDAIYFKQKLLYGDFHQQQPEDKEEDIYDAVADYRKTHPDTTKDIFLRQDGDFVTMRIGDKAIRTTIDRLVQFLSTPESREESKDLYKALKDLYEWAYDLLGGANAPEGGDSAELKAARKILKTRNP